MWWCHLQTKGEICMTWDKVALRESTTNVNRNVERGSPCWRSLEAWKKPFNVPLNRMENHRSDIQPIIHLIHLAWKPFFLKTYIKKASIHFSIGFFEVKFTNQSNRVRLLPMIHTFICHKDVINNLSAFNKCTLGIDRLVITLRSRMEMTFTIIL